MATNDDILRRELERSEALNRELLGQLGSLESENQFLTAEKQSLVSELQSVQSELQQVKHQLAIALQMTYGRRSEKLNPAQLQLLFAQEDEATAPAATIPPKYLHDAPDAEEPPARKKGRGQAHPGRAPLPPHLPRERIEIHPEDLHCPCCQGQMKRFDEEITEELGRIPARFYVRQYVRVKYACPKCQDQIVRPELPARVFEKGKAGADVVAEVAVAKYADHLPLHRQAVIYKREGVSLDKATMCDWLGRGAELLAPIVQEMHRQLLLSPIVQSDDTQVQYLDPGSGRPAKRGYLWTYLSHEGDVLYDFKTSRSREGPSGFLAGYQGYLQVDGYAGYNEVTATEGVTLVACWAHARRKFVDARESDPHSAAAALLVIRALYEIEARSKDEELDAEAIAALRQEEATPALADLEGLLRAIAANELPQSPIAKAAAYALERWPALCRYCDDGRLEIDNNSAERAMRRVAIGRKNWLFAGRESGGHRAAIYYSLIETCCRHEIDPCAYLTDVLNRISTYPQRRIAELTPRGWLAARTAAPTAPTA
jgi:transposase